MIRAAAIDGLLLVGLVLVAVAAGLAYLPLGVLLAGLECAALAVVLRDDGARGGT